MEVKYEELIKKIKDICFNDFYVEIKYLLDDDKKRILSSMYQSVDDVQIDSFNEISSRRWKIYEYNIKDNNSCFVNISIKHFVFIGLLQNRTKNR